MRTFITYGAIDLEEKPEKMSLWSQVWAQALKLSSCNELLDLRTEGVAEVGARLGSSEVGG